MSDQPPPSPPSPGSSFCAECGAVMPIDARFCGSCGAAPPGGAAPAADAPTETGGASTWQGVAPVVEKPGEPTTVTPAAAAATAASATAATPTVPSGPPPPGAPPPGGPPPGGPPEAAAKGKGKGPLIVVVLVVLAALIGGFLLLAGGDDEGDDDVAAQDEEDDEDDDEETTTTEDDEETTTTGAAEDTTTSAAGAEQLFDQLIDDTGTIVVEVPVEWVDRTTAPAGGQPTIEASTALATFRQDFSVPGMFYTVLATTPVDFNAAIDNIAIFGNLEAACVPDERVDYDDGVFVGRSQFFRNCAGDGTLVLAIAAANPAGVSVAVYVQLTAADPQDEIIQHIADTFNTTAG